MTMMVVVLTMVVLLLLGPSLVPGMSTPPIVQVAPLQQGVEASGSSQQEEKAALKEAKEDGDFMEDIGFSHFFTDVGLQSSASNLGLSAFGPQHQGAGFANFQGIAGGNGVGGHAGAFGGVASHAGPFGAAAGHSGPFGAAAGHAGAFGGGHGFGIGAASNQEPSKAKQEDLSFQGFIPSNPFSFGDFSFEPAKISSAGGSYAAAVANPTTFYPSSSTSPKPSGLHQHRPKQRPYTSKDKEPIHYKDEEQYAPTYQEEYSSGDNGDYTDKRIPSVDNSSARKHQRQRLRGQESTHNGDYTSGDYSDKNTPTAEASRTRKHPHQRQRGQENQQHRDYRNDKVPEYDSGPRGSSKYQRRPSSRYQEATVPTRHRSESRPAPQYERGAKKAKEEPCKVMQRDGMTCKVCKDEEGGFSEHCSHSTRQGKDSTYANSRRGSNLDASPTGSADSSPSSTSESHYEPEYDYRPRSSSSSSSSSPYQRHSYQPHHQEFNEYLGQHSNPVSSSGGSQRLLDPVYEAPRNAENFGRNTKYDPFPDDYNPYAENDGSESRYGPFDGDYETEDDATEGRHDHDFGFPEHNKRHHQQAFEHDYQPSQSEQKDSEVYIPRLNSEDNFAALTKMMTTFAKKDRTDCRKVTKKNGMTCYMCQGGGSDIADQECMYQATQPDGEHSLMYTEERSYGNPNKN